MLLLVGYLMMIRTAERRNAAGAVLCFLEGAYLAMLCFAVLPPAMGTARFWGAAGCAAAFVIGLAVGESFVMQTDIMLIAVAVSAGRDFWQRNIFHGMCFCGARCFFF